MQLLSLDDKVNSENEVKHTSYGLYGTSQEDCILKWLKVKTKDFKFKSKSNAGVVKLFYKSLILRIRRDKRFVRA